MSWGSAQGKAITLNKQICGYKGCLCDLWPLILRTRPLIYSGRYVFTIQDLFFSKWKTTYPSSLDIGWFVDSLTDSFISLSCDSLIHRALPKTLIYVSLIPQLDHVQPKTLGTDWCPPSLREQGTRTEEASRVRIHRCFLRGSLLLLLLLML